MQPNSEAVSVQLGVSEAKLIAGDAIVFHDEPVAEKCGPAELANEWNGELLERIGQDDELDATAQGVEKVDGAGQR